MTRLFLHAGFHKTGTTAIQECAFSNRRRLLKQGILYPDFRPVFRRKAPGHHRFSHAIVNKDSHMPATRVPELASTWYRQASEKNLHVLLSAEPVCRHVMGASDHGWLKRRQQYLEALSNALQQFDVEPVLVLRRQDEFVRSLYQEHVMKGTTWSAKGGFKRFRNQMVRSKMRFLDNLRIFKSVFGQVRVLVYEDLVSRGLLSSFFHELGASNLKFSNRQVVRASLSVPETLIKRRLNRYVRNGRENDRLLAWLHSRKVSKVLTESFTGRESLWASQEEQVAFQAGFKDENVLIAKEFLGRRNDPFPEIENWEKSDRLARPEPDVIEAAVARVAAASPRKLRSIIGADGLAKIS